MLCWYPVSVSKLVLTTIAGADSFSVLLFPMHTKSMEGCFWVFLVAYEAAWVHASDKYILSRVCLGSWDRMHFQWCFSKEKNPASLMILSFPALTEVRMFLQMINQFYLVCTSLSSSNTHYNVRLRKWFGMF